MNCPFTWTGDGSPGIEAVEGTEVLLAGNGLSQHEVRGGWGGQNCHYWNTCEYGGQGAPAVELDGELWHSGTSFMGGTTYSSPNCGVSQAPSISKTPGSTVHRLVDADPTLTLIGTPAAGATVQFEVAAPAGADVLLYLGRKPVVIPDPSVRVELLTPMQINWPLGIVTGTTVPEDLQDPPAAHRVHLLRTSRGHVHERRGAPDELTGDRSALASPLRPRGPGAGLAPGELRIEGGLVAVAELLEHARQGVVVPTGALGPLSVDEGGRNCRGPG